MEKIRRYFKERFPDVPFWVVIMTNVMGFSVACFIVYKIFNFVGNHINLMNPTPWERVCLLSAGGFFAILSYYSWRKAGFFKRKDDQDEKKH